MRVATPTSFSSAPFFGTHTTYVRNVESGCFASSDCSTPETPRRHVPHVGEANITTRTIPLSALNAARNCSACGPSAMCGRSVPGGSQAMAIAASAIQPDKDLVVIMSV